MKEKLYEYHVINPAVSKVFTSRILEFCYYVLISVLHLSIVVSTIKNSSKILV